MTKFKYDWQLKYRRLITEKPFMMFFLGLVLTIIFGIGLKGLSQNPDNRIFFSDDDPNLVALETLENTYTKNDNLFVVMAPKNENVSISKCQTHVSIMLFSPNLVYPCSSTVEVKPLLKWDNLL